MPRSYEGEYSNDSKNSEAITLLRKQLELQDQQIAKLLEAVNKKTCTAISPIKSMAEAGKIEELADSDKQEDDEDEPHDVKKVKKKGTEIRTVKKKQVIETDEEDTKTNLLPNQMTSQNVNLCNIEPGNLVGSTGIDCFLDLPVGWKKKVTLRKDGKTKGKSDTTYYSPLGEKCRSKIEIARYIPNFDMKSFCYKTGTTKGIDGIYM